MAKLTGYSRISGDEPLIEICIKYHQLFTESEAHLLSKEDELNAFKASTDFSKKSKKYFKLLNEIYEILLECCEYAYISIVFSVVYLEVFIYDYAASSTSDTYAKKYLDSLNIVSKWVIIPKLLAAKKSRKGPKRFNYW